MAGGGGTRWSQTSFPIQTNSPNSVLGVHDCVKTSHTSPWALCRTTMSVHPGCWGRTWMSSPTTVHKPSGESQPGRMELSIAGCKHLDKEHYSGSWSPSASPRYPCANGDMSLRAAGAGWHWGTQWAAPPTTLGGSSQSPEQSPWGTGSF